MGFGVAWIDILRPMEPFLGFGVIFPVESNHTQIVKGTLVSRIEIQDCAIKRLSRGRIMLSEPQIAEREKRFRIFRHIGIGDGEFLFRQGQIVRFERLPARVVGVERPERGMALRPGN